MLLSLGVVIWFYDGAACQCCAFQHPTVSPQMSESFEKGPCLQLKYHTIVEQLWFKGHEGHSESMTDCCNGSWFFSSWIDGDQRLSERQGNENLKERFSKLKVLSCGKGTKNYSPDSQTDLPFCFPHIFSMISCSFCGFLLFSCLFASYQQLIGSVASTVSEHTNV